MSNISPVQFKDYVLKVNPAPVDDDMANHAILAEHNGRSVGKLEWDSGTGDIQGVEVDPEHRRKGIATAMWNRAQEVSKGNVGHSPARSDEGDAWARSVGGSGLERRACTECGDEGHLASEHK
jgi:GNAT superfamily N-acetyltransferase